MELRPYQQEAREAVKSDWASGFLRTLLVLPTGCGKTIVFSKIVEDMVRSGRRCLILAHRGELLDQAADKLLQATGLRCSVEKAEETCLDSWYRVTVGSIQSLMREKRLGQFPADYFDVIVVDEAHHVLSDGYQRVLTHFEEARVLGVTATPDRGDMRNLGQYFEHLAYEYTLPRAIKDGYLCPIKAVTIPLTLDLSHVGVQAGDFKNSDVDTALDPYLHQIAEEMHAYCENRKTVVFLPLVRTSQKFCRLLNAQGVQAAEVNGNSQDRAAILQDFEAGKYIIDVEGDQHDPFLFQLPVVNLIDTLLIDIRNKGHQISLRGPFQLCGKRLAVFLFLQEHPVEVVAHLFGQSIHT